MSRVAGGGAGSVTLCVRESGPDGRSRTARVSRVLGDVDEEVAFGLEVPLEEAGAHSLALSLVPGAAGGAGAGAPVEVAVLDAGTYRVVVAGDDGAGAGEERSVVAAGGETVYGVGTEEMLLGRDQVGRAPSRRRCVTTEEREEGAALRYVENERG